MQRARVYKYLVLGGDFAPIVMRLKPQDLKRERKVRGRKKEKDTDTDWKATNRDEMDNNHTNMMGRWIIKHKV